MRTPRLSLPVLLGIAALLAVALARTDAIRARAEAGLGQGMPAREAALARGFVLGDDEGVDQETKANSTRAVLGIYLLAGRIRDAILARGGSGGGGGTGGAGTGPGGGWRRALAEGAGVTVAATLATAPLIAFYFEEASLTTLAANLLAMPAVA